MTLRLEKLLRKRLLSRLAVLASSPASMSSSACEKAQSHT